MATRWNRIPDPNEDVVQRTSEDVGKVKKRMNVESSGLKGGAKEAVREAGGRAASRLGARAGAAGVALQQGYELGRDIDERTGIGKKLVDKVIGKEIDRAVNKRDKVELSEESKERIKRGALDNKYGLPVDEPRKMDPEVMRMFERNPNYRMGEETEKTPEQYKRGGKVSASSRADGIAKRGKTRGRMY